MAALSWYDSTTATGSYYFPITGTASSGVIYYVSEVYWPQRTWEEIRKQKIAERQANNYEQSMSVLRRFQDNTRIDAKCKGYKPKVLLRYDVSTRHYQKRKRRLHETA